MTLVVCPFNGVGWLCRIVNLMLGNASENRFIYAGYPLHRENREND